jgi:general secretion pathway protein D
VFVLIPHIIRGQEFTELNTRAIDVGTASVLDLRRVTKPAPNTTATPAPQTPMPQAAPPVAPVQNQPNPPSGSTSLRFNPAIVSPAAGSNFTVDIVIGGASDLFSAPTQISFDPSSLQFVSIANGDLLSKDGQAVALVHREDGGNIQASATRPPGSGGASGDGTLYTLTFAAKKSGQSVITLRPMFRNSTMQTIAVPSAALNVTVK